jgi:fused signal recognition particle receptor
LRIFTTALKRGVNEIPFANYGSQFTFKPVNFFQNLAQTFANKPIDWDALEEALIRANLGVPITTRILKKLQDREAWSLLGISHVIKVAREELLGILPEPAEAILPLPGKPKVVLIVGVNGTGKTTSIAKLAHHLQQGRPASRPEGSQLDQLAGSPSCFSLREHGSNATFGEGAAGQRPVRRHTVLLAAADTFRAAAIEQLGVWAERLGVEMIKGQYHADPAALCYEAYQAAIKRGIDFLLCDTAGRLHTKSNLMAELQKIKRALAKQDADAPHEILLVIDATTGGNALSQAREFHQTLGLTGLIVTKLDGSGKGGIVVAIQDELKIPTRFIGTGEKIDNFAPFDAGEFVANML